MAYDINDPKNSGLLNAALTMLALSGPSSQRRTFGSILGESGQAGINQYRQQKVLKQRDEELARRNRMVDMQMRKMEEDILNEQQMDKWVSDPANLMKMQQPQSAPGDYGPGDAPTVGPQETTMQPKGGRELAMSMLRSGNPLLAKMGFSQLAKAEPSGLMTVGNNIFDPNTRQFITPPQSSKPVNNDYLELLEAYNSMPDSDPRKGMLRQRLDVLQTRAPNQALEVKIAGKEAAKGKVSENLQTLAGAYYDLDRLGAAVSDKKDTLDNIIAFGRASKPGQFIESAIGTQAQTVRNRINQMRPLLIQEIRQAVEMGARGLDSNRELEFYLQAATDPMWSIESNIAAMAVLDRAYGLGLGIKASPESVNELKKKFGGDSPANPIAPQGGLTRGQVVDDYMYLGGDPKNPSSWAKTP